MGNNSKLAINSLLMFNKLDSNAKIVLNKKENAEKRKKSNTVIFDTYRLILSPFFDITKDKKYVGDLKNAIAKRESEVTVLISSNGDVKEIENIIRPVLDHLKKTVKTCKLNHDELKEVIHF